MLTPLVAPIETVLVPLDFGPGDDNDPECFEVDDSPYRVSGGSLEAVRLASHFATTNGAKIRLLHVVAEMSATGMYAGPVRVPKQLLDDINDRTRATAMEVLRAFHHRYFPELALDIVVRSGKPSEVILEEAERPGVGLIVMATSDHHRLARFILGTTADRIIRAAPCPVTVVPPQRQPPTT